MDLASLQQLVSPAGQRALERAIELAPDESTFLSCFNRLARDFSHDLARTAVETALLRRRAAGKFSRAAEMYFTREALEHSASETVAGWRARRFAGFDRVADLCCGIGGDAAALAEQAALLAIDRDPLRLALARLNLKAYGVAERAEFVEG